MSDPIADMLTRIRNASLARHSSCDMPFSKMKWAIAEVLRVQLRYAPGGRGRDPILMGIKRISKPGLRVYARSSEIPRVFGGLGTPILSTPQGVMSGARARRLKVGGEVLAHVW